MELHKDIKTFYAKDRKAWRKWLAKNHQVKKSVWLIIYKKECATLSIHYPEAVDEALCLDWQTVELAAKNIKANHYRQ